MGIRLLRTLTCIRDFCGASPSLVFKFSFGTIRLFHSTHITSAAGHQKTDAISCASDVTKNGTDMKITQGLWTDSNYIPNVGYPGVKTGKES